MYLFITLPGGYTINSPVIVGGNSPIQNSTIGGIVSAFLEVGFYIAGFMLFAWLAWGGFEYLFSSGKKENLESARKRITYALVGFAILMISFAISQYIQGIYPKARDFNNLQQVTPPSPSLKPAGP